MAIGNKNYVGFNTVRIFVALLTVNAQSIQAYFTISDCILCRSYSRDHSPAPSGRRGVFSFSSLAVIISVVDFCILIIVTLLIFFFLTLFLLSQTQFLCSIKHA